MDSRPVLSVGFILADNFTLSALSLFVDALRLAADDGDHSRQIRCKWAVMAAKPEPIRSSCGVMVSRTSPFVDPRQFDYLVIVGGIMHHGPPLNEETRRYLHTAARANVILVGVCTGSFILCREGLMRGRRCCVHWLHYKDFLEEFTDHHPVADQLFVVDHDRITCSGGIGVADLAAFLITRHIGRAAAQKSLHVLMLNEARRGNAAQPHPPIEAPVADERVRRALLLMEQNMTDPLPISVLAARLRLSTRQIERLFSVTIGLRPAAVYRQLRLRYARWLLENTGRSITDVALEAGFSDCAHFSRQFKELFSLTPSEARGERLKKTISPKPTLWVARGAKAGRVPDTRLFE